MNNKEIEDKYSDVTIILPSYNEEDSIAKVISDVNNECFKELKEIGDVIQCNIRCNNFLDGILRPVSIKLR